LACAFLLASCDHTLVVGDHGVDEAGQSSDPRDVAFVEERHDTAPDAIGEPAIGIDVASEGDARVDDTEASGSDVDARASDADASAAEAASIDAIADRRIVPGCLLDGVGGLTFQSSGGLVLDIVCGNEISCDSSVMGSMVSITDLAPRILSGIVAL